MYKLARIGTGRIAIDTDQALFWMWIGAVARDLQASITYYERRNPHDRDAWKKHVQRMAGQAEFLYATVEEVLSKQPILEIDETDNFFSLTEALCDFQVWRLRRYREILDTQGRDQAWKCDHHFLQANYNKHEQECRDILNQLPAT